MCFPVCRRKKDQANVDEAASSATGVERGHMNENLGAIHPQFRTLVLDVLERTLLRRDPNDWCWSAHGVVPDPPLLV